MAVNKNNNNKTTTKNTIPWGYYGRSTYVKKLPH